jgi:hypothetical protein
VVQLAEAALVDWTYFSFEVYLQQAVSRKVSNVLDEYRGFTFIFSCVIIQPAYFNPEIGGVAL